MSYCPRCGRLPYPVPGPGRSFTPKCSCSEREKELQDEINRLKAELDDAKKVPDGWKLVRTTDIVDAKHQLEKAMMWNGQGWDYNPLHPMFYRPAIELLDAMLKGE